MEQPVVTKAVGSLSLSDLKSKILYTLLEDMKKSVTSISLQKSITNVMDTVVHTAPEYIDARRKMIYHLCLSQINDNENEEHQKCFELYTEAMKKYSEISK